jgi:hypothetical protein
MSPTIGFVMGYHASRDGVVLTGVDTAGGLPSVTTMPVDATSSPGVAFQALVPHGADVKLGNAAALSPSLPFAGVALAAFIAGDNVPVLTSGPLVGYAGVGVGPAGEAVGTNAAGTLVRASDLTCISRLQYVGFCDAAGLVYVTPFSAIYFDVTNYGADPTGVAPSDAAFAACVRLAIQGDQIVMPQGTFLATETIGPLAKGVTLRGAGGENVLPGVTYLGSVINYVGLGDGVRVATSINANVGGNWLLADFLVRCTNIANEAPQRQSPVLALPGAISSIVAAPGGAIRVAMTAATGLPGNGALVAIDSVTGTVEAIGGWSVRVVDAFTFDLVGSTFTNAWTGGGNVRRRCGAGVAIVGGAEVVLRNVYTTGFGVGILLDGAETITIDSCQSDGYAGNNTLGTNPTQFSCGVWLADGDSGCSGWTTPGSTNVITLRNCYLDGARISIQCDGTAQCNVVSCENPNIGSNGQKNTAIVGLANDGSGQIEVHAVANGIVDGQYVGITGPINGVAGALGEWKVQRVDADHFILLGSTFAGAWISGGVVHAWCPATFARINRATALKFDSCYTEGAGDAHFIFERQSESGSSNSSAGVMIQNHLASGACPSIYVARAAVDGAHAAESVSSLRLDGNTWLSKQSIGGVQVSGYYWQLDALFSSPTEPGLTFWDAQLSVVGGIVSYKNAFGGDVSNAIGGIEGTGELFLFVQDNVIPVIRVTDNNVADYVNLVIHTRSSTSESHYVNSPGFGDKAGRTEPERSATLAASVPSTLIATTDVIPPKSNSSLQFVIVAHRDDDSAPDGAFFEFRVFTGQAANGSLAIIGAPVVVASGTSFDAAQWSAPTFGVNGAGNAIEVFAAGNFFVGAGGPQASTWETSGRIVNSQRAR